jgi:hypothetical protein
VADILVRPCQSQQVDPVPVPGGGLSTIGPVPPLLGFVPGSPVLSIAATVAAGAGATWGSSEIVEGAMRADRQSKPAWKWRELRTGDLLAHEGCEKPK